MKRVKHTSVIGDVIVFESELHCKARNSYTTSIITIKWANSWYKLSNELSNSTTEKVHVYMYVLIEVGKMRGLVTFSLLVLRSLGAGERKQDKLHVVMRPGKYCQIVCGT